MSSEPPSLLLTDRSNRRKAEVNARGCEESGYTELQPTRNGLDAPSESNKSLKKRQINLRLNGAAQDMTDSTTTRRAAEAFQHGNLYSKDIIVEQCNEHIKSAPSKEHTATRSVRTFGTPLSTILEQKSCATLDSERKTPPAASPTRVPGVTRQISRSLDEAALHEFRTIVTSLVTGDKKLSSDDASEPLNMSILHNGSGQVAEPNYAIAFARSATPPGIDTWSGDREPDAATNSSIPPTGSGHPTSKKGWLRFIRDYLRITTPSEHGQTVFSRESIQAARSTSRPAWQASRNSFNYRGRHPFELDQSKSPRNGSHKTSSSRDGPNGSSEDRSRDDLNSGYTTGDVPIYNPSTASLNMMDGQQDQHALSNPTTIRAVQESPKRLPLLTPTHDGRHAEQTRAGATPTQRVRFEDFPSPPLTAQADILTSSPLPLRLPQQARLQSVRSAALDSVLPVAASQGIARPILITRATHASTRPPSPQPPDVSSHHTRNRICRHRAKQYLTPHMFKDSDALVQQMERMDPVDGVIDANTARRDLCWRCAARNGLSLVSELVVCCGRCESKGRERDDVEGVELPAWNNV